MKNLTKINKEEKGIISEDKVRAIVSATQDASNTMFEAGQQFVLCVEEVLIQQFGFTDKDIKKLHKELHYILEVSKVANGLGLSTHSLHTTRLLADIVEIKKNRIKAKESHILLPKK